MSRDGYEKAQKSEEGMSEYELMELLELLESIREYMEDAGVTTLEEVIQHIEDLHKKLDRQ